MSPDRDAITNEDELDDFSEWKGGADEIRPRITVEFPYDPEDNAKRSASSQTFFAAWVNQYGVIEWTCTDEIDGRTDFGPLVDLMETEPE